MKQMFAVMDLVAARYMEPFFTGNAEQALRGFKQACENVEHDFNRHPTDFVLAHLGEWNEETGELTALQPRNIAAATQYVSGVHVVGHSDDERPVPPRFNGEQLDVELEIAE